MIPLQGISTILFSSSLRCTFHIRGNNFALNNTTVTTVFSPKVKTIPNHKYLYIIIYLAVYIYKYSHKRPVSRNNETIKYIYNNGTYSNTVNQDQCCLVKAINIRNSQIICSLDFKWPISQSHIITIVNVVDVKVELHMGSSVFGWY